MPCRSSFVQSRQSPKDQTSAASRVHDLDQIRAFRDGNIVLRTILESQREGMKSWGNPPGRFQSFYVDGLGLDFDDIAFANVAWCATEDNRYPRTMLNRCFSRHTGPLLSILRPDVVLASGSQAQAFAQSVSELLPATKVIKVLHYAHREGAVASQKEFTRVRSALAAALVGR